MKIRKAILPVAGLGTRFLPAVKAQPKTMLTIVDKPIIQFIVEEVVASGIEEIIFVTDQMKRAIEDHFDRNAELEQRLESKGKTRELEMLRHINNMAKIAFVRQQVPLGDGHAILSALPFIGPDEPVMVLYGDDLFSAKEPVTRQLIDAYEKHGSSVIALYDVGRENVSGYGIAKGEMVAPDTMKLAGYVEKPSVADAPSSFAGVGRYLVTPEVLEILKTQAPAKDGEIRLADAFKTHLERGGQVYGKVVDATRYDCGNKLQFMMAAVDFALKHQEVNGKGEFAEFLSSRCAKIK